MEMIGVFCSPKNSDFLFPSMSVSLTERQNSGKCRVGKKGGVGEGEEDLRALAHGKASTVLS